jgi:hypothetical protein
MTDPVRVMPDLAGIRRSVRHRVDSALLTLLRMGTDFSRIVLESAGAGESPGAVVSQSPDPGVELTPATRIVLRIGGGGSMDLMPFSLRDESETELRGDRFFALFDNPALKLGFYLRHGGGYLALHPDEPLTARRWLEDLFAVRSEAWSEARWHAVARLVPRLHALGGTEAAVRVAMAAVFALPVDRVEVGRDVVPFDQRDVMRLGTRGGRLGFDAVLGSGVVGAARVSVTFGPVSLAQWRVATAAGATAERRAIYPFILPAHVAHHVNERWRVGDGAAGSCLGLPDRPALLGVNAYLESSPVKKVA